MRFATAAVVVVIFLLFASAHTALTQWPALSSGYAATTDNHGSDVLIGQPITGWAGTTDPAVKKIQILWLRPNESTFLELWFTPLIGPYVTPEVPIGVPTEISDWSTEHQGISVRYAYNTQIPDESGDWAFKAVFWRNSNALGEITEHFQVRTTSFEVIPEVPFGTIAILLSWCGILGGFALRRKHMLRQTALLPSRV